MEMLLLSYHQSLSIEPDRLLDPLLKMQLRIPRRVRDITLDYDLRQAHLIRLNSPNIINLRMKKIILKMNIITPMHQERKNILVQYLMHLGVISLLHHRKGLPEI